MREKESELVLKVLAACLLKLIRRSQKLMTGTDEKVCFLQPLYR